MIKSHSTTLSVDRVRQLLCYEMDSGTFYWRVFHPSGEVTNGNCAGNITNEGYICVGIDGKQYLAHRLAFFYINGVWPTMHMDHKNGIKHDNRWDNIRPANYAENRINSALSIRNKSGYKGVSWHKARKKWAATIGVYKKHIHLGLFETPRDAALAYNEAAINLHGEFARINEDL